MQRSISRPGRRRRLRTVVVSLALAALTGTFLANQVLPGASAAETPLSQGRPATASSTENSGTPASAAVDGNPATRWSSAAGDPQWLQVDLGGSATVNQVVLNWERAYAIDFTVQTSANGSTWTTVKTVTNGTGGVQTLAVNGTGRYVRVHTTKRSTQYGVSLFEFQVFGTGGGPIGAGWIKMDQAKWSAQLAEFNAMRINPAPANAVRVPEFNATCTYSHSKKDDPIVFPGLPGASHMHSFFGNRGTDANSTTESLLGNTATSCGPAKDLSAYWIPTLYERGVAVEPSNELVVYYGSRLDDPTKTVPFPQGFRMIAGDAKRQVATPDGAPNQFWCAGDGGSIGRSTDGNWPICAPTANLTYQLVFPDCWDGIHLDSPDHKSHVGNAVNGRCSGAFPVAIPSISFVFGYDTKGSAAGFTLASGMASSMHGDTFFAWDNAALGHRVKDCIVQKAKCNTAGNF
ncbi:DUF1996 domain-containing protein [Micromonospora sp. DT233]|uniref:DUF1996 domain-containing protein n=1 Tax=Micromonospora sp. DT233 TaxID=3393432 RepID=UPI003CF1AE18